MEKHRTYEQDPRLGMIALAEIGSRALSPAVNDPGTAVEVLGAMERALTELLTCPRDEDAPQFPRVHVPAVELTAVVEDAFRPIARDGAGMVEVALRLHKVLGDLVRIAPHETQRAVLRAASARSAGEGPAGPG